MITFFLDVGHNSLSNIYHKHPNYGNLLVDVTQPLVQGIHQLIDSIIVHDARGQDRRGEL